MFAKSNSKKQVSINPTMSATKTANPIDIQKECIPEKGTIAWRRYNRQIYKENGNPLCSCTDLYEDHEGVACTPMNHYGFCFCYRCNHPIDF